jgi:hypothetical protein
MQYSGLRSFRGPQKEGLVNLIYPSGGTNA